ncbi:hypothetical protein I4U23_015794 [Adineta vaga]|nr:hypothetical protein I4U23_015794 [Adineta vaga]
MVKSKEAISALNYFPWNQTCQLFYLNVSESMKLTILCFMLASLIMISREKSASVSTSTTVMDTSVSYTTTIAPIPSSIPVTTTVACDNSNMFDYQNTHLTGSLSYGVVIENVNNDNEPAIIVVNYYIQTPSAFYLIS